MKGLRHRIRDWRDRRAWEHHLGDVEKRLSLEYARFTILDIRRREQMRKLWRKIHNRDSQRDYVS